MQQQNPYVSITETDFGGGIDAATAENATPPTYLDDCKNVIPTYDGLLTKRKGYVTYGGYVPFRVLSVYATSTTELLIRLPANVDAYSLNGRPIIIGGRTSVDGFGTYPNIFSNTDGLGYPSAPVYKYFTAVIADSRKIAAASTTTTISVVAAETGLTSKYALVQISENTDYSNRDNSQVFVPCTINTSTYTISADIVNGTASEKAFYIQTLTPTRALSRGPGSTWTILQSSHLITHNNIIARFFDSTGVEFVPDSVVIASNGDITATIGTSKTGWVVLAAADQYSAVSGTSVGDGSTLTITLNDLTTPWLFCDIYLQDIGGARTRVIPESISVDESTNTATIQVIDGSLVAHTFVAVWSNVTIPSTIKVTTSGATPDTSDTSPQLCLWGLDHEHAYINGQAKAGWVSTVDSYSTATDRRLVCGLGWNVFSAQSNADIGTTALLPNHYPLLEGIIGASSQIVGPAFVTAHVSGGRTRGDVAFPEVDANGYAVGTSLSYDSGFHKIVIPATSPVVTSTPIAADPIFCDYLTIEQAPYPELVGSFKIRAITYGTSTISIWIESTTATAYLKNSIFDISNVSIKCGVFSDKLTMKSGTYHLPGDICTSDVVLTNGETPTVTASESSTSLWLNGFTHRVTFSANMLITFKRINSRVFQVRNIISQTTGPSISLAATASFNIVDGDTISLTGYNREFRVVSSHAIASRSVTISAATGTEATVTCGSSITDIKVGMYVPIFESGYAGTWQVTAILTSTSFKIATTVSIAGSTSAVLGGSLVELDEAVPSLEGSSINATELSVTRRWIPIEASSADAVMGLKCTTKYFSLNDYDLQPPIRSVTIANNMYFTNGDDYVMKYDGTNIMRAGLPRWQAQCFMARYYDASGASIFSNIPAIGYPDAIDASQLKFLTTPAAPKTANPFKDADIIYRASSITSYKTYTSGPMQVISVADETSAGTTAKTNVTFTGAVGSSGAYFIKPAYYRYYIRINLVDANGNIIPGATTGYDDLLIASWGTYRHIIKLIVPPSIPLMNFERIEVELYRTKGLGVAPFYRIKNVDVTFNNSNGYLTIEDYTSDDQLTESDVDAIINTGLQQGTSLAPNIQGPPKAKYITSSNNRLLLGNITSHQSATMSILEPSKQASTLANLDGKRFTIYKDGSTVVSAVDMINGVTYELRQSTSDTVTNVTFSAGVTTVTLNTGIASLTAGEWVYLTRAAANSATPNLRFAGWFQVSAVNTPSKQFSFRQTLLDTSAFAAGNDIDSVVVSSDEKYIPVYLGTDYSFQDELGNQDAYTKLPYFTAILARRLSYAINASMRMCDTAITGMESFVPWLVAGGGGDFKTGELQISVPIDIATTPSLQLFNYSDSTDMIIYGNGIKRIAADAIGFITQYFPSRMLMSYANYPEVFDNPFAEEKYSDSVLDINPSDGQYITGIIPMFGSSAFQLSQKAGYVIVFKERSIYVVNTEEKAAGRQYLQKLETNGIGCTLPYSIAYVKGGIAFANEAGIYRLNDQLKVELLSYKLGRLYSSRTDLSTDSLLLANGHHSPINQQYVLSYVNKTDSVLDEAWVYNYRREDKRAPNGLMLNLGSWCRYDNIPATVWCNQDDKEYFGSTKGRVFQMRAAGDLSDYRDDASGVGASVTFRAMDFGDTGIRKQCKHIFMAFRNGVVGFSGTQLSSSTNLETATWLPMQSFTQRLSSSRSIDSLRFSNPEGRFQYLQIKAENSTIDESMEIAGITYRVIGLSSMRTTEASGTGR